MMNTFSLAWGEGARGGWNETSGAGRETLMLCNDFEDRLTDYLDGVLEPNVHKLFAEHALLRPVCHETLSEVKNAMQACQVAGAQPLPRIWRQGFF